MKDIEQYFYVVLFTMLYKMVLTFKKSVDETLVFELRNSNVLHFFLLYVKQLFLNASSHLLDLKNKQEWLNAQKVPITPISFTFLPYNI